MPVQDGAVAPKHSRNRSKASCIECYRRKQKCNRKWPCNHCYSRKVGHLCQYSTPKPTRDSSTDIGKSGTTQQPQNSSNDADSGQDTSENDDPYEARAKQSRSSPHQLIASSIQSGQWDRGSLDKLGYLEHSTGNLLGYLKTMDLCHDMGSVSTVATSKPATLPPEVIDVLQQMPSRPVTDILIQHFFTEANWIYEMVDLTTYLEAYETWWSHPCQSVDDVEFAVLLLRLCCYTAQFLPSMNYTADTILGNSLGNIRVECDRIANALASSTYLKAAPPSLPRIHQLFFRACYLKNEGDMKGSWDVLSEAIREAQELGLHLDLPKGQAKLDTEYNIEMGKRTYWNLWLWDKFMSIILGRWPLIPDQRCSVSLPHNTVASLSSDKDAPDTFSERRLQIELTKIASELLSCVDGKQSRDPAVIDKHVKRLNTDLVDRLPPAFRINESNTKWDDDFPNLKRQREMLKISIFATICSLLKPIILAPVDQAPALGNTDEKLATELKRSLIQTTIQMLGSVARLHELMGGKQNRFFLLSFFTLEPAALLGMCLMSMQAGHTGGKQREKSSVTKPQLDDHLDYRELGRERMDEALARLKMLSEVSPIAKTGSEILGLLMTQLDARTNKTQKKPPSTKRKRTLVLPPNERGSARSRLQTPLNQKPTDTCSADSDAGFEKSTGCSVTPSDSYSDGSQKSPSIDFGDLSVMTNDWTNMNQNQKQGVTFGAADLGKLNSNLFEAEVPINTPSVGQYWPAGSFAQTDVSCNNNFWLPTWTIPPLSADGGLGLETNIAMDQALDWSWIEDSGMIDLGMRS